MDRYLRIRQATQRICSSLEPEETVIQPWPFVSPAKWHLAHTTWFFETFCLRRFFEEPPFDARFHYLFNSYYESQGERLPQDRRGLLGRPFWREVLEYRRNVDERMREASRRIEAEPADRQSEWSRTVELGLQHEMQHQELLWMDLKAVFFHLPGRPALIAADRSPEPGLRVHLGRIEIPEGVYEIGTSETESEEFSFDNERPRHRVYLEEAAVDDQLVTNADYLAFVNEGGYQRPELWLAAGWEWVRRNGIEAPLYWLKQEGKWAEFTLAGVMDLDELRPVSHVNYFEADAFARWQGARLPTEAEWEAAARAERASGPAQLWQSEKPAEAAPRPTGRLSGSLWQWTQSSYLPYPGFSPFPDGLGEYNGKFMCGQMVLRGGCLATPAEHFRPTYRNFFGPEMRWQFSGIRLARSPSPKKNP